MNPDFISAGEKAPDEVNVIIEIPANSDPIKYEMDKASGALFVDRFIATGMRYPCNYGYIPHTLALDGDPADVLVITPFPVMFGSVIRVRPVAMLNMEDESGHDNKILAVPVDKLCRVYSHVQSKKEVDAMLLAKLNISSNTTKSLNQVSGSKSRVGKMQALQSRKFWTASSGIKLNRIYVIQ